MPCTGTYRISSPDSHTRPQSRAGSASKPAPAAAPRSGRVKHAVADDVRAAHVAAATEADRLGHHGYLGCEHLLLGLLSDDDSIATRVLAKHGVHLEAARREVNRMIGEPSDTGATTHTGRTMTPRANNVGVLAQIEAERLGAPMPNSAHYLLALLTEGDSVAVRVLEALGANLRELRSDLLSAMQVPRETSQRYIHERDTYLTSS
jgi:ATP-dependent Clp protease ATP-binding subunit ClpA